MYEFDLGLKIKSYRLSINLTQAQFGERIGVSGAAVSFYETGTRTPSHRVLVRIANVMGVSSFHRLFAGQSGFRSRQPASGQHRHAGHHQPHR